MLAIVFIGMGVLQRGDHLGRTDHPPAGLSPTHAGLMGALMLLAGVCRGGSVVSALSDRQRKRVRFLVFAW